MALHLAGVQPPPDPPLTSGFTLGVEEELFVVEPQTLTPTACSADLLAGAPAALGVITEEMCDGVVELATPVCRTAAEAGLALLHLRREFSRRGPVELLGSGVHPTLQFGDVVHRRGAHYDRVSEETRSLLRQSTYCGAHVHVGMPDRETTIAAFNGMRKWIPVLQALGANSPFWYGRDSGLASARTVICHTVPRTRLPRAFRDWDDYASTLGDVCHAAQIPDAGSVWWDMRPHPALGTLEVRALDSQSSLFDLVCLTALVHGLVHFEAYAGDDRHPSVEVLDEASFRALRDGIDGAISIGGPVRPVRELVRYAMELAADHADALGCRDELDGIEAILRDGNGAVRQRRAYERDGLAGVLAQLRRETAGIQSAEGERAPVQVVA
jgi:glutamate---cysteine ligase / carboxylate-amine ligase